jgi:hypothetical protein
VFTLLEDKQGTEIKFSDFCTRDGHGRVEKSFPRQGTEEHFPQKFLKINLFKLVIKLLEKVKGFIYQFMSRIVKCLVVSWIGRQFNEHRIRVRDSIMHIFVQKQRP